MENARYTLSKVEGLVDFLSSAYEREKMMSEFATDSDAAGTLVTVCKVGDEHQITRRDNWIAKLSTAAVFPDVSFPLGNGGVSGIDSYAFESMASMWNRLGSPFEQSEQSQRSK